MKIEILRIGQRLVRDDRVTTHVALVARAFGASKIYMDEVNPEIKETINKINKSWGGNFKIEIIDNWKDVIYSKKNNSVKIVHLTMYGESINQGFEKLLNEEKILVIVGAEKVPREIYDYVDYNISIGNQPHSEISSLAVFLDRIQKGNQFEIKFEGGQKQIVPTRKGKKVIQKTTRD